MCSEESISPLDRYNAAVDDFARQVVEIETESKRVNEGNYQGVSSWSRSQQERRQAALAELRKLAFLAGKTENEHHVFLRERHYAIRDKLQE
ncbi:MAG: hypothetical protein AAB534_01100 [Patescibacteria group bacterium]|mgnify:CR=1 FL=1